VNAAKVGEIPFSSARKWGALVMENDTYILGAPERVLSSAEGGTRAEAEALAEQGLRVITFAHANQPPENGQLNGDVEPLALIVLSDQIRGDIQDTLQAFRDQQVGLKVISGDNLQ